MVAYADATRLRRKADCRGTLRLAACSCGRETFATGAGPSHTLNEIDPVAQGGAQPVFELSSATRRRGRPKVGRLILRRPKAALALVPEPAVLFAAGAVAGAIGKTLTAPLDRVKLLLQTRGGFAQGSLREAARRGKLWDSLRAIGQQEGIRGYWRGNLPQILKVIPYSATQLSSYELFKRLLRNDEGDLSVSSRLAAGACAGMTATLVTYPLDTLRLRMAVDTSAVSVYGAARILLREGSYRAFFRGLGASLIGIAPYMAMELCIFDLLPGELPTFVRGFSAALLSTTACYPLDTIRWIYQHGGDPFDASDCAFMHFTVALVMARRHIQLQSSGGLALGQMAEQIWHTEGVAGFYRGFVPSAIKNLPNKGIRLTVFDNAKKLIAASRAALEEEGGELDY